MPSTAKSSSVAAKSNSGSKAKIKYADKSAAHSQLVPIFEELKKLFLRYETGTLKLSGGTHGQMHLVSHKPVEILGRRRNELFFASALVQKGYVGFYFMPVYMNDEIKKKIEPELLRCLKGKACFHLKNLDYDLFAQVDHALRLGCDCWKRLKWL